MREILSRLCLWTGTYIVLAMVIAWPATDTDVDAEPGFILSLAMIAIILLMLASIATLMPWLREATDTEANLRQARVGFLFAASLFIPAAILANYIMAGGAERIQRLGWVCQNAVNIIVIGVILYAIGLALSKSNQFFNTKG